MPYEHSPEERLKRYKQSLEKMAKEEGRNLKFTKQETKTSQPKIDRVINPVKAAPKKVNLSEFKIKVP